MGHWDQWETGPRSVASSIGACGWEYTVIGSDTTSEQLVYLVQVCVGEVDLEAVVAGTGPESGVTKTRRFASQRLPLKGGRRLSRSDKQHVAPDTPREPRPFLPQQFFPRTCRPTPSRQTRLTITQQRAELPSPALSRRNLIVASLSC